jgi:GNAT superfamily N-acetyltransferase
MRSRSDRAAEIRTKTSGDWTRVYAEADGRDVSHLTYFPVLVQVGDEGRVRMAGIGGVATEREFRRGGLGGQVFAQAIERIRREGYACVGLHTSQRLVAHRLYRRSGLVDVVRQRRARKLLDPQRCVRECLASMIEEGAEARRRRPVLRVELHPHDPVFIRLEEGDVQLAQGRASHVDLTLTMSSSTLLSLSNGDFDLRYGAASGLVRWRGDPEIYHLLADAVAARRRPIIEG